MTKQTQEALEDYPYEHRTAKMDDALQACKEASEQPEQELVAWKHFDKAYSKACNSSQPQDWMDAALLAQQARNTHPAPPAQEPVAWTSTKALQNAKLLGAGDLWLEFDENYAMDAKEIGSKSKQIPLYTHPAPVCKCGER